MSDTPNTSGTKRPPRQSRTGLTSTGARANLDMTARAINVELKAAGEESFVSTANPVVTDLAQKLEIVKFVIAAILSAAAGFVLW